MAWQVLKVHPSPLQFRVTLKNDDASATVATDYQQADALARRTLGAASLSARGYGLTGHAMRTYASQNY